MLRGHRRHRTSTQATLPTEAEAAGWVQEVASPDFATTMTDVYSTGIKATGTGTLSMGIDHFSLQDPSTPTENMTWGAIKTLYR